MNMKTIKGDIDGTANSIIDISLCPANSTIEGLAYVHDLRNCVTRLNTPYITFQLRGKHNLVTTANLFLSDRNAYDNIDALYFKDKIVYIKGEVTNFSHKKTINLEQIQEFNSPDLSLDDFFDRSNLAELYSVLLKDYIQDTLIQEGNYGVLWLLSIQHIIETLNNSFIDSNHNLPTGGNLVITYKLLKDFTIDSKKDYREAYLTLLYMYSKAFLVNLEQTDDNILNNNASKIYNIMNRCDTLNAFSSKKETDLFLELLSTVYCGTPARTHLSKVVSYGEKYYTELLASMYLEHSEHLVHDDNHIKMR